MIELLYKIVSKLSSEFELITYPYEEPHENRSLLNIGVKETRVGFGFGIGVETLILVIVGHIDALI